jgi:hypothetical protein
MYDKWEHEPPATLLNAYNGTGAPTDTYTAATSAPISSTHNPPPSSNATSNNPAEYPTTAQLPTYTYLQTLRRDFDDGIPSAIALMRELGNYTQECLHEQEEWKADRRAEIRLNHNITYPKRDYLAPPRSWDTAEQPGHGLPDRIEASCPLRPGLKRRHYRNARSPRYRISQPRPPREPRPLPEPERPYPSKVGDTAPYAPPSTGTLNIRRYGNNNTAPHLTARSCPPPWPNKYPNQNQHQNQHNGKYTLARNTTGQRPPPQPNIPTPSAILSIANSRPPPWPNQLPQPCCHHNCHHHRANHPISLTPPARPPPWPIIPRHLEQTLHNHRNAKRRIKRRAKAESRRISDTDKVSI